MKQQKIALLSLAALVATVVSGCSGGSSSTGGLSSGATFLVLKTEPLNNGRLFLNDPIRIDFTNMVNLESADLNTVSFTVFDQNQNPVAEQPAGQFMLDASPGDDTVGRRLLFVPKFPTNDTYTDGGFRPGRSYLVQLVAGDPRNNTVLRDIEGHGLSQPVSFRFNTAEGTTPAQLFRDTQVGGPRRVAFEITPTPDQTDGRVELNKFGTQPVELRLTFNQPLNPNSANVPVALDTNPLVRSVNQRGRIYLEYNDPAQQNRWIPADVDLEVNSVDRSVVVLRPVGVLPNNADIKVIVENTLEDISGESNVANAAYDRVFATFTTKRSYNAQFDAVVESFNDSDLVNFDAPFLEPQAEVKLGYLRAGFDFEGSNTQLEYEPNVSEVVLSTDFTQIVPKVGSPFNVSGGVFQFRNVFIPQGVRVRGIGSNPMVWLVSGNFRVAGEMSVRGGNGQRVDTLNSANFPTAAGIGACGGGNGGKGSPNSTDRSMTGEAGFGPGQVPGGGGGPGNIACLSGCTRGSGGGGGSMSTQGDPYYKSPALTGTAYQQRAGAGGNGCAGAAGAATRNLAGGLAGPLAFTDSRQDNDFWGTAVDVFRQVRITGEFSAPVGGAGGGGGGDRSLSGGCTPSTVNFIGDNKGGGGGGGGGVLVIKALGDIIVEASGRITADGGHGGGGEAAGSCDSGGGGGAGSGGMIILMAGHQIVLHAKGVAGVRHLYGHNENDYSFCVSADGGLCTTGTYGAPVVADKYPASGQTPMAGGSYDAAPLGAFGGMGVVQLMAPPGDASGPNSNYDNTNTVLDDNIIFYRDNTITSGTTKQRLIAWRGFLSAGGTYVNDSGGAVNIGSDEGDIRPAPLLLPVTYASRTRVRSHWIDTGASRRRPLVADDNLPRGIVVDVPNNLLDGPAYRFAGTRNNPGGINNGFVDYISSGTSVSANYPLIPNSQSPIQSVGTGSAGGETTHTVVLANAVLGNIADRYVQHEAEFLNDVDTVVGSHRILAHTANVLQLSRENGSLPATATKVQVRAKFFQIKVNGAEGMGPTYPGVNPSEVVPVANVRIGFAFHTNPAPGAGGTRYPADPKDFVFNLTDPAVQETIRNLHASYIMWDVLFDTSYKNVSGDVPPSLNVNSPRPELHFLRIPYQF